MNPWYEYHDFLFGRSDSVRDLFRLGIRRLPLVFDHTARVGAQARADRDTAVAAQAAAARELIAAESAGAEMASSLSGEFDERGSVVSALKYASESLRLAPANHPQRQFFLARASQLVLRAPADRKS